MPVSHKRKDSKKSSKKAYKNNNSSNMIKMKGGGSEGFIIVNNEVLPARKYQANALEENIINDAVSGPHQYKEIKHSYMNGTVVFTIVKTNTRIIEYPQLTFKQTQLLYTFINNDGKSTYISQDEDTLVKLLDN